MIEVLSGKKAIEKAFQQYGFQMINIWIYGKIEVVANYQKDNPNEPWKHFWHAKDKTNEVYISIFDIDNSIDKSAPQKILQDGELIWHQNKPYVLRLKDDDWLIAPPFAILHPEWLLPLSEDKSQKIYLVEAFDAPESSCGYYWKIPSLGFIPVSPATEETLSQEQYKAWLFEKQDIGIAKVHLHDCKLHLEKNKDDQVYLQRIRDDYGPVGIVALLKDAINLYSENSDNFEEIDQDKNLVKNYQIPSNTMELLLSYLDNHYGMTLPRDKTYFTQRQLATAIGTELNNRFFV